MGQGGQSIAAPVKWIDALDVGQPALILVQGKRRQAEDVVIDAADTVGLPFQQIELLVAATDRYLADDGVAVGRDGEVEVKDHGAAFIAHDSAMTTTLDARIIARDDCAVPGLRLSHDDAEVLVNPLQIEIGQFLGEIVIDDGVGELRPAVNHVPPQNAAGAPFLDPEPFNEEFLGLGLDDLGG